MARALGQSRAGGSGGGAGETTQREGGVNLNHPFGPPNLVTVGEVGFGKEAVVSDRFHFLAVISR